MSAKTRLYLHMLGQILAQGAVAELVPSGLAKNIFAAVVAVVGVLVAFADQSITTQNQPPQQ